MSPNQFRVYKLPISEPEPSAAVVGQNKVLELPHYHSHISPHGQVHTVVTSRPQPEDEKRCIAAASCPHDQRNQSWRSRCINRHEHRHPTAFRSLRRPPRPGIAIPRRNARRRNDQADAVADQDSAGGDQEGAGGVRVCANSRKPIPLTSHRRTMLTGLTSHRQPSFPALSLSYNGGKDCLVLLILYLAQLHAYFTSSSSSPPSSPTTPEPSTFPSAIPSIYAKPPDPFPAITTFVATSSTAYHLSLTHVTTTPSHQTPRVTFRDAFDIYLKSNPGIKAIFVGTRRTDPHGKHLTHFDRTDKGWPDFMRIHPVIDWHLSEIWCFLRAKELGEADGSHLAYCSMYDEGYTSLGGVNDTSKNPKLKEEGGTYRPAYELTMDSEERLGR